MHICLSYIKYREGYIRTSSSEYSLKSEDVENRFIHLTNNAVQKYSNAYGTYEEGNQLSFTDFENYIQNNYEGNHISFKGRIISFIKEMICKTLFSVRKKINSENRQNSFEIFGYDFIIDSDFNPWLIEINSNPCLELSSKLLQMLIPRMINDAFKLTLDIHYTKPLAYLNSSDKVFPVEGYSDSENMFEKICDLNEGIGNHSFIPQALNSEYLLTINRKQNVQIKKNTKEINNSKKILKKQIKIAKKKLSK